MSKAIVGAAELAGAAVLAFTPGLNVLFTPLLMDLMFSLALSGAAMEAGAIAEALTSNRGQNITTRQAAGLRQIIYGIQRVGGTTIWQSTTGGQHWQWNMIIVLATHEIDAIENLYLDGRQVYWNIGSTGNVTRNGVNFGGDADSNTHIGPGGPHYNFGTLVYCEARFGDQSPTDVIAAVAGNDPSWTAAAMGGPPSVAGCAYVYLKVVYHSVTIPQAPEIRFTVRGRNKIYDPRTGIPGFSTNWALCVADVITDATFGLGDNTVNRDQLIAAANVCDEQVLTSQGYESRYAVHLHYDTSTSPGNALEMMMDAAAGRFARIGGEWFIFPAYWQGPSYSFDQSALIDTPEWNPKRSFKDLFNRVNGTYIAPNYPYNVTGNLYDSNGWWNGTTANNWPFAFQPTNFPQYAVDTLHGYSSDVYLAEDTPTQPAWNSGVTYNHGDLVSSAGVNWQSLVDGNIGNTPSTSPSDWSVSSSQLPKELQLRGVLSVAQAQRVAKITLLRNRFQGTGIFPMKLAAWQMQTLDVMQFTWALFGWGNKQLEVTRTDFACAPAKDQSASGDGPSGGDAPLMLSVQVSVAETDISIYQWSLSEELTIYDVPVLPVNNAYDVQPPTSLSLVSNSGTALTGADGIVTPRVLVTWVAPLDARTAFVQIQYKLHSSSIWIDTPPVDVSLLSAFIAGVVSGNVYDFQIRSLRSNGAPSVWVQQLSFTVGAGVISSISASIVTGLSPAAGGDASGLIMGTVAPARLPSAIAALNSASVSGPSLAAGATAQVGTGATASASGTGLAGEILLSTGTGTLAGGTICVLTFPAAFGAAPRGCVTVNGATLPDLAWIFTASTLTLSVTTPLAASTSYKFEYNAS